VPLLRPPLLGSEPGPEGAGAVYTGRKGHTLLAPIRFLWNATRGHRLTPWRSDYVRWRVETYSGKHAETLTAKDVMSFAWASRWELLNFLLWTGRMQREARKRV